MKPYFKGFLNDQLQQTLKNIFTFLAQLHFICAISLEKSHSNVVKWTIEHAMQFTEYIKLQQSNKCWQSLMYRNKIQCQVNEYLCISFISIFIYYWSNFVSFVCNLALNYNSKRAFTIRRQVCKQSICLTFIQSVGNWSTCYTLLLPLVINIIEWYNK